MQLNVASWTPRQDHGTNRLVGGPLQLAPGTQLLLDETVLAAGQLLSTGILNLQVLVWQPPCCRQTHQVFWVCLWRGT